MNNAGTGADAEGPRDSVVANILGIKTVHEG